MAMPTPDQYGRKVSEPMTVRPACQQQKIVMLIMDIADQLKAFKTLTCRSGVCLMGAGIKCGSGSGSCFSEIFIRLSFPDIRLKSMQSKGQSSKKEEPETLITSVSLEETMIHEPIQCKVTPTLKPCAVSGGIAQQTSPAIIG
jgi:hypothetical protein